MAVVERGMPRDPYWDYEHDIKQALSHAEKLSREAPFDASVRTPLGNTLDELRQDPVSYTHLTLPTSDLV